MRKPKFIAEILALVGLALYTCETRRTNNLTQKALDLQYSTARAFVQVTGTDFSKGTIEDVQSAGTFSVEFQNVGKATASKVHGVFVVELPLANQEPSFNLNNNPSSITTAPMYPDAPTRPAHLIFVANYGTVPQLPAQVIQELKDGTRYAVIFGRTEYEDPFGSWWIQFCAWRHFMPLNPHPHVIGFPASRCVDYNTEGGTPKQR